MVLHYTSIGFGPDGGSLYKSMPWKNYYAAALAKLLARSSGSIWFFPFCPFHHAGLTRILWNVP